MNNIFDLLSKNVIDQGLCTHCGTCVGLSKGSLIMSETNNGPIPIPNSDNLNQLDPIIYDACPGKGLNYPDISNYTFNDKINDWLLGYLNKTYIGYSNDNIIRRNGASGGIITQVLVYLLSKGIIDGAIVSKMGIPKPWKAKVIIATSIDEIIECSQSIYSPVPVNEILNEVRNFDGKLGYVGLPDQVLSIRYLQSIDNKIAKKISFIIGPYVGTNMYIGSIKSFLRSNGYKTLESIKKLQYRAGEWPGYLKILTDKGEELKAEKFYYNYLIPFYITKSCLYTPDFTNELTDISVGDAWHPDYEKIGKGFSVIIARSLKGKNLLEEMKAAGVIKLEDIDVNKVKNMHGHMLDFKKRGSFIRFKFLKIMGKKVPNFGYLPKKISIIRIIIEVIILSIIIICSSSLARKILELFNPKFIGPPFNYFRLKWKNISKPSKRKGLENFEVKIQ